MNRVDKILEGFQGRGRSVVNRKNPQFFSYKSDENVDNITDLTNADVNSHFNKDRMIVAKTLKKKALLSNLSANFKTALAKNFEKQKDFKCCEKPKKLFMADFYRQSDLINKIGKR